MARIALVHVALSPTVGGVETYLVDLAGGLRDSGHEVIIYSGEKAPSAHLFPGVRLEYSPDLDVRADGRAVVRAGYLIDQLRTSAPEVVHAQNLNFIGCELLDELGAAMPTRTRLVHTYHSMQHVSPPPVAPRRWWLLGASKYISQVLERNRVGEVNTLPLPVNTDRFTASVPAPSDRFRIFQPSRCVPEKGQLMTLALSRKLVDQGVDVHCTLAINANNVDLGGRFASYAHTIQRTIEMLNLTERIHLSDYTYETIAAGYENSDLVVHPSTFEEPFGLAVLEGMAARRSVIASAAGGVNEIIEHGVSGLLFRKRSALGYLEAVESVRRDEHRRADLADKAFEVARSSYSVRAHVEQLEVYYGLR